MNTKLTASCATALLGAAMAATVTLWPATPADAQVASLGYTTIVCPAGSDTRVSVPLEKDCVGEFTVASGSTGNSVVLEDTSFTANEFQGLYYARFTSGVLMGRWFTIAANGSNTLMLNTEAGGLDPVGSSVAADLTGLSEDDTLLIVEHWTTDSIFPDGFEGISFAGGNPIVRPIEILVTDESSIGINKASNFTLFYNGLIDRWTVFGPNANADKFVFPPQSSFVVRNNRAASTGNSDDPTTLQDESTGDVTMIVAGDCKTIKRTECLPVEGDDNDVVVSAFNLFPTTLAELQLGGSAAFETSPNPIVRADELLVFDRTTIAKNKASSDTFYYLNGGWRRVGAPFSQSFDGFEIPSGASIVIRKSAGSPGTTVKWEQTP